MTGRNVTINVLLFAGAREALQTQSVRIDLQLPNSVNGLKKRLANEFSELHPFLENGRIAIASEFVNDNDSLSNDIENTTVALIPPVSGG